MFRELTYDQQRQAKAFTHNCEQYYTVWVAVVYV